MTTTRSTKTTETPLARDLFYAARYYLGGRRGLIILAGLALIAGLAMNWSWLVAAGVAPILISALPCAAMCALGLCMNRAGGKSCAKTGSEHRPPATTSTDAMSSAQMATCDTPPPPQSWRAGNRPSLRFLDKPETASFNGKEYAQCIIR